MQVLKRQVTMSIKVLLLVFPSYAVAEWPDEMFSVSSLYSICLCVG